MCSLQEWHLRPDKTNHGAPAAWSLFLDSSCCLSSAQMRLLWCCLWLTAGLWQWCLCFSIKVLLLSVTSAPFSTISFVPFISPLRFLDRELRAAASSTVNFGIEPSMFRMSVITHRYEVLYMMLQSPEPNWSHLKAQRTFAAVGAHYLIRDWDHEPKTPVILQRAQPLHQGATASAMSETRLTFSRHPGWIPASNIDIWLILSLSKTETSVIYL